jgi:hypothetical protein
MPSMNLIRRLRARGRLLPFAAAALLVVVAATGALASRAPSQQDNRAPQAQDASEAPEADEQEAPPTAEELAHVVDRLAAAGIETDADAVGALAADHGLGGAVRLLAWSNASGMSVDKIAAMRAGDTDTAPMGWGQIAKDLGVHPGIGNVMGGGNGNGHGRDNAPGQDGG